ncbi:MAG: fluoride efflux transporter CrcB [Actinomycetota bacterium]|nr:fluoride efflux transporter CrcB [Actinomycetota bacterium]
MYLVVAAAGAVGAPARYLVDIAVQERRDHRTGARSRPGTFPLGTFIVNATGSFLLGLVVGLALHHGLSPTARAAAGTGFCGAYTTFSAFSYETVRLAEKGLFGPAALNVAASTGVGLVAAALGLGLAILV